MPSASERRVKLFRTSAVLALDRDFGVAAESMRIDAAVHAIAEDGAGSLAMAGGYGENTWLQLLDATDLQPLWATPREDQPGTAEAVAFAPDGDILVAGSTSRAEVLWLMRYGPDGTPRWPAPQTYAHGGEGRVHGIAMQSDGTILVARTNQAFTYCE